MKWAMLKCVGSRGASETLAGGLASRAPLLRAAARCARREPPAGLACLALCPSGRGDGLLLPGPGGCRAGTPSRGLHADGHRGDSSALPRGGPPGRAAAGSKLTSTGEGPTRAAGWRPRSRFATPADGPRAGKSV